MEIALDQLKEKKQKQNADDRKIELGRQFLNSLPRHKRLALTATVALIQYRNPILRPQALIELNKATTQAESENIFDLFKNELIGEYPEWTVEFVTEKINESRAHQ